MAVEVQRLLSAGEVPGDAALICWAAAAAGAGPTPEICLRIVDEAEGRALNLRWRGKDHATNVLSFPGCWPPGHPDAAAAGLIGDVVLCAPVIAREAAAQRKPPADHWAHLVVHGVLHLRGFDHIEAQAAAEMERIECRILAGLGVPDPYRHSPEDAA